MKGSLFVTELYSMMYKMISHFVIIIYYDAQFHTHYTRSDKSCVRRDTGILVQLYNLQSTHCYSKYYPINDSNNGRYKLTTEDRPINHMLIAVQYPSTAKAPKQVEMWSNT